jgi:hypothetical protein
MRTFLAIYSQKIIVMIRSRDVTIRARELIFKFAYRALEPTKLKEHWSRHLEDFNQVLFVDTEDPLKLNPFSPYKRIVRLAGMDESRAVHHIISSFESQYINEFDKDVFFCWVEGLLEEFVFIPNTAARVADVLIALRTMDRDTERGVRKEARYTRDKEPSYEAAQESQIIQKGKS